MSPGRPGARAISTGRQGPSNDIGYTKERTITTESASRSNPLGDDRRGRWLALAVAGTALAVYVVTLAPGLSFAHSGTDGGDLIAAAVNLGIPHPSGYPTYTLLAWLFSHLPVGVIAYRVNLLSALSAAGTAGLLCRIAQLLFAEDRHRWAISAVTALTLAFSSLLWAQAVISEVYALLALFCALLLWLLLQWRKGDGDRFLWLAGLTFGLGLGNHLTLAFAAPPAVLLLWSERKRWLRVRALVPAALLFVAGLSVYAYLPLAAAHQPPVNWGNPQTWNRFLWVVTGHQYQPFAFGLEPAKIPGRLGAWAELLGDQFGWWGLAISLAGGWWWWRRDRRFALFTLAWMLLVGLYAFFYDTGDSHVYLVSAFVLLALWWGEGARYLLRLAQRLQPIGQRLALLTILALPLLSLALHWRAADPDDDWHVHAYIYQALEAVDPGGLVVVRGDRPTFALWYGIYAEGQRPDVAVVSGPLMAFIWYREHIRGLYPDVIVNEPTVEGVTTDDLVHDLIRSNLPLRPVYATDPKEEWEAWFDFVKDGDVPIYRVRPRGQLGHGE
jgi:hypothetical protein